MPLPGYNVRKAAQVIAFFAKKAGGQINVLIATKLAYLADREFLALYDLPILFDNFVSMPHGPVPSMTLSYVNGEVFAEKAKWEEFVSARADHNIGLATPDLDFSDLDELSDAEIHVLDTIWDQFGGMGKYDLRNYTHKHCPEWEDPAGSSERIPYERVLKYLNKERSAEIAQEIESLRSRDEFLVNAR
jgi:uncharacterized phage-associated protein